MSAVKQIITDRVTERLERLKLKRTELEQIVNNSSIYEGSQALQEIAQIDGDIEATEAALNRRAGK